MAKAAAFDVTPEELNTSAQKIQTLAEQFTQTYNQIYQAVEDLVVSYKGQSSETFNKQIENYRKSFNKADTVLQKYVEFLTKYADNMNKTEQSILGKAQSLSAGNI